MMESWFLGVWGNCVSGAHPLVSLRSAFTTSFTPRFTCLCLEATFDGWDGLDVSLENIGRAWAANALGAGAAVGFFAHLS